MKRLYVEDVESLRRATARSLKHRELDVIATATVAEAVASIPDGDFALILDFSLADGETGADVLSAVWECLGFEGRDRLKAVFFFASNYGGDENGGGDFDRLRDVARELPGFDVGRLRCFLKPGGYESLVDALKKLDVERGG